MSNEIEVKTMRIKSYLPHYVLAAALGSLLVAGCRHQDSINRTHVYKMPAESKLGAHTHNTILEFKSQPAIITAGQPSIWLLKIFQLNGITPVKDFAVSHEKLMHLIVVSKDLAWFNHIHPYYDDNGLFVIRVILPHPGTYKLYADYTPKDGRQEVPQSQFEVMSQDATGNPAAVIRPAATASPVATSKLVADNTSQTPVTKQVNATPESEPDTPGGAAYQVQLLPPTKLVADQSALLHFQVRNVSGQPVTDLQPYLGAMGHAVVLSADTNIYLHTHPVPNDEVAQLLAQMHTPTPAISNADVFFPVLFPKAGLYKMWVQFQHQDKIITAPFVLRVGSNTSPPPVQAANVVYVCPMHPNVTSKLPNQTCPKCGMPLIPKTK